MLTIYVLMEYRIDNLGQLLNDASRAIRRRFEQRTAEHGLSATQWRLLRHAVTSGPATQAMLATALDVEPISVSRLVDRMEQSGWVIRVPHPDDRRARIVQPTEKAMAVAESVRDIAFAVYAEALAPLDDAGRRQFHDALLTMIETLSHAQAAGTNPGADKEQDHE